MPRLLVIGFLGIIALSAGSSRGENVERPLDTQYLRDHAETFGFMLGRPVRQRPTPDGKAVLFLRAQARAPKLALYEFDVATAKTRELLTPEQILRGAAEHLSPEEKARRERQRIALGGITDFQFSDDGALILVSLSGKLYLVRRQGGDVRELPTGPGGILDPKFSPDGTRIAFVRDNDVFTLDLAGNKVEPVTRGGTDQVSHGLAEFVAQEEMDRYSGYWWSPDSKFIFYEEADATAVERWHVADPAKPDQPALDIPYPRPGKANVKARLGIIPATGGETTWVRWDSEHYPYLGLVRWDEGGPPLIVVQTRDQRELALLQVDRHSGATRPLVLERDSAWVNLRQDVPRWLEDGRGFLWVSERDGGPRLELRAPDGALARVLAPPAAGFRGLVDVDSRGGGVVYVAAVDPTQSQLFRVPLAGGPPAPLTTEPGIHSASFSKGHGIYARTDLTLQLMPHTAVYRANGERAGELPVVAEDPPFVPTVELLKVGDGEGLYASVVRPRDFNPKLRYAVIDDVYGGPHVNHVMSAMPRYLLSQWMADQGFIVVSIDNRGTPGRGRNWERAIFQRFGSVPLEDQVAGLKALGAHFPEMDLDRVGMIGWSFGGYMSGLSVLRRPDVFKAAVAGAPVTDWYDYDTHYTERYLGVPEGDAPAYKEASLLTYAADLSRPLLLVHGTADDNVYFRHSLRLSDALFRAGRDFEMLPLSGFTHMVHDPIVTQRLWSRIIQHFQRHLGSPRPRD